MIALFTNWIYVGLAPESEQPILLNALVGHQFRSGTEEDRVYTAVDVDGGYGFSQVYRKVPPSQCIHGVMFKHERGVKNPEDPSFDDLVAYAKAHIAYAKTQNVCTP